MHHNPDALWDGFVHTPAHFLGWALASGWTPTALPVGVVFTFQSSIAAELVGDESFEENHELTVSNARMYLSTEPHVLVSCLNPGAASMTTQMEHLRYLGDTTRFAAIVGTAGGLVAGIHIGDRRVVSSALAEDGISARYSSKPVTHADTSFTSELKASLDVAETRSWSVAVPYRQTRAELDVAVQTGAEVVEMETAALFAAGEVLGYSTSAAVVVTDVNRVDGWESNWSDTREPLNDALRKTVSAIQSLA